MPILGLDVSHFQGALDFAKVKASGRAFVVLKATDGTGYLDPTFAANRRAAHAAGLIVGIYHFVEGGATSAEAAWYLSHIVPLQPSEFLVLDFEVAYAGDHVAWCRAWLDTVRGATGVAPLIYMNKAELSGHAWGPVASTYGLWLASYDNSTAAPASGAWSAAAMKQYSDKGTVPGVGTCDVNVFNGSADQLLAYGLSSTGADMTPAESQMLSDVLANVLAVRQQDFVVLEEQVLPAQVATLLRAPAYDGGPQVSAVLAGLFQAVFQGGPSMPDGGESIGQSLADLRKALATVQAPVIDEAKLAAALLADPASIAALGKAIADNLQLSPRQ